MQGSITETANFGQRTGKQRKRKNRKKQREKFSYKTLFRTFRVFGYLYKTYWKPLAATYIGLLLTVAIALLLPWPLKLILDHVILSQPFPPEAAFLIERIGAEPLMLLAALVAAYIVLYLADSLFSYLYRYGLIISGEKMAADIRYRIFEHLQRLSLTFHNTSQSGDLVYRLTFDINHIKVVLVDLPNVLVYRIVMAVAHLVLMAFLDWRLSLIAASILPILYYYNQRFGSGIEKATKKKRKKESSVSNLVSENITAMALVQAYGREDTQQERFSKENRKSMDSGIKAMRLSKIFKRLNDILIATGTSGVALYGGMLALQGDILPGTLVLFVAYLRNIYKPIKKFASMMLQIAKAQVSCERLLELVDCDMVMEDAPKAKPLKNVAGKIEFKDVNFGYHIEIPVLKNINFDVKPGETIALVGHSGSGKSTLISLLMRFYDPQQGKILVDGKDIRNITLKSLREQITILMQEAQLFNKTVAENIGFGKIGAAENEIIRAAKRAQAHQFISDMPEGYQTMISEDGENLSGGQKQRINIARAMIRNTPILILDEPATALDAKSEAQVHKALEALTKGKTTFIIAHKFSTIAHADKILVLDNGNLAGFGKHDQLLKSCKPYRNLYEIQFGEFSQALATINGTKNGGHQPAEITAATEGEKQN